MNKFIIIFTLILNSFVFGQVKDTIIDGKKVEIYYNIDRDAEFPEGFEVFKKLIMENFDTSKVKYKKKGRIFTVIVFVVQKDGSLGDFSVSGENKQFNKEALNAIKKVDVKWSPALINNLPARQRFKVPLYLTFD
ncbi:energy transducer TonB [Cloacibacterium caeni]|jgi:protein TonB|uniref:energy transducer TonB n=1 Tax=Cloacibacterium caeni TaxID=2004710 RepID=UPI001BD16568|nr:energy transducer TonB [Cloacibacterium caeni]